MSDEVKWKLKCLTNIFRASIYPTILLQRKKQKILFTNKSEKNFFAKIYLLQ